MLQPWCRVGCAGSVSPAVRWGLALQSRVLGVPRAAACAAWGGAVSDCEARATPTAPQELPPSDGRRHSGPMDGWRPRQSPPPPQRGEPWPHPLDMPPHRGHPADLPPGFRHHGGFGLGLIYHVQATASIAWGLRWHLYFRARGCVIGTCCTCCPDLTSPPMQVGCRLRPITMQMTPLGHAAVTCYRRRQCHVTAPTDMAAHGRFFTLTSHLHASAAHHGVATSSHLAAMAAHCLGHTTGFDNRRHNSPPPQDMRGGGFRRSPPRDMPGSGYRRSLPPPRDVQGSGFRRSPQRGPPERSWTPPARPWSPPTAARALGGPRHRSLR